MPPTSAKSWETLPFSPGQMKEDVIFHPDFIIRRRWQCSCHESGKPHLQPWAGWTFQEKSLRHSAKQCLDYTGSQHSRAVVMPDKPLQMGWNKSEGWSLHLLLKMESTKVCLWLPQATLFFAPPKAIPVILNPLLKIWLSHLVHCKSAKLSENQEHCGYRKHQGWSQGHTVKKGS